MKKIAGTSETTNMPPVTYQPFVRDLLARCTIWQHIEDVGLFPGEILLSFDDGPNLVADTTSRLLDTLKTEKIRAAFCVCGKCVREAPHLVRRMYAEGHLLVNHGDQHLPLTLFSETALEREIQGCDAALAGAVQDPGFCSSIFRPACGWRTPAVQTILGRLNRRVLPITDFGNDTSITRHNYLLWVDRTRQVAQRDRGGIFVLHDRRLRFWGESHYDVTNQETSAYRGWVPEAISALIRQCRSDGFVFLDPAAWNERLAEFAR
jgi:peptidoglycan/xylan/chitin deacetylase (PgdA/CDA1 family)